MVFRKKRVFTYKITSKNRGVKAVKIKRPFGKKILGVDKILEILFYTQKQIEKDDFFKSTNSNIFLKEILLLGEASYKRIVNVNSNLDLYLYLHSNIDESEFQRRISYTGFDSFSLYDILVSDFKRVFLQNYFSERKKLLDEKKLLGILYLENLVLNIYNFPFDSWNEREKQQHYSFIYNPKLV